jgi:predicted phosphoribosyltransferase
MKRGAERGPDIFSDRREAGRLLGEALHAKYAGRDIVVLGLPRGGVPVAHEVARVLGAPLDVLAVRKLGAPFNREFALGAIATGGARVLDLDSMAYLGFEEADLDPIVAREQAELERRERLYRSGRGPLDLREKTAILVDDGIATGSTMAAAVQAARALGCRAVVAAAPTASREAVAHLERAADAVEVLRVPEPYIAVGVWYGAFPQLTDDEVVDLLARTAPRA